MTTLEFCRKHIVFGKAGSPITGPFRETYYPFLTKPFEAADDIRVKRLVLYKSSSSMGTVAGQCILAKRVLCDVGDILFVAQSDEDAATWSKTRGKELLQSIPDIVRIISREKYAITNDLYQFRGKFLAITGPGISSAQSLQVGTLMSDESHLPSYPPGRLVEFEKRLGGRWCRKAIHVTTAPDAGKEVDGFYLEGQQDEWHYRCPACAALYWPLWGEDARERYNGEDVFQVFGETVVSVCPHCQHVSRDNSRERYALVKDGDYVAMNPEAPMATRSFRWSALAAHWIGWAGLAVEHKQAMEAAKLGNLKPLEDWTKKRTCKAWTPILPDFGDGKGSSDYALGDEWICGESERFMGVDRQAGKGDEGEHLWVLVAQYDRDGNSRRLAYRKVETFSQAEAIANDFGVKPQNVYVDSGYENRSTFRECGKRKWFATRGTDESEFTHTRRVKDRSISFTLPYSEPILQSGIVGQKQPEKAMRVKSGQVPRGWAIQIAMANQTLYGYLAALLGGSSGRYFGVASDFPNEYRANMPAFIAVNEPDKKTGTVKKTVWKKVREDHGWDCEVQALLGAIRAGFFPLAKLRELSENESAPVSDDAAGAATGGGGDVDNVAESVS